MWYFVMAAQGSISSIGKNFIRGSKKLQTDIIPHFHFDNGDLWLAQRMVIRNKEVWQRVWIIFSQSYITEAWLK